MPSLNPEAVKGMAAKIFQIVKAAEVVPEELPEESEKYLEFFRARCFVDGNSYFLQIMPELNRIYSDATGSTSLVPEEYLIAAASRAAEMLSEGLISHHYNFAQPEWFTVSDLVVSCIPWTTVQLERLTEELAERGSIEDRRFLKGCLRWIGDLYSPYPEPWMDMVRIYRTGRVDVGLTSDFVVSVFGKLKARVRDFHQNPKTFTLYDVVSPRIDDLIYGWRDRTEEETIQLTQKQQNSFVVSVCDDISGFEDTASRFIANVRDYFGGLESTAWMERFEFRGDRCQYFAASSYPEELEYIREVIKDVYPFS